MKSIFSLTPDDWIAYMQEQGHKPYRAKQAREWLYQKLAGGSDQMPNLPSGLRQQMDRDFTWQGLQLVDREKSMIDMTEKYLWQIATPKGDQFFESVLIFNGERVTACLSSQIGCRVGCTFCKTATVSPVFNLPGWSMIEQYWQMRKIAGLDAIHNVVFMGMGEPFHNYRQVIWAANRFTDHPGFFLHPKRITISTSGILPVMDRYLKEEHPFRIAISLNAPDSARRLQIIPNERKWPIPNLVDFANRYYQKRKKRVTFEYVMIQGFNDAREDGVLLGKIFAKVPAKVNVIPYNESDLKFKKPTEQNMNLFVQGFLQEVEKFGKKSVITIRRSAGSDISGACGQLAGKKSH